ncbi:MAG TPA: DUF4258 domain-containing protein [Gammaproteobacteria bacterium]|nr:DUF4258 domain-containing protein [Gammaproteobacteria bacterium]
MAEGKRSVIYRAHAIKRMFERRISEETVRAVLSTGEVIESYPDDVPYPSKLVLGWSDKRPIHIVLAETDETDIIITVYEPDPERWDREFRHRRLQ